ncbi:MAG: hypothetical protein Fur0034_18240 [Desulfuromonadia bacterium]
MDRFINTERIMALHLTTPDDNPLVTDSSRMMDVWFDTGGVVRKHLFKRVTRREQEELVATLQERGFVQSGNLLLNPRGVLFAEMESQLVGGVVTIGFAENGKAVELKVKGDAFSLLAGKLCQSGG